MADFLFKELSLSAGDVVEVTLDRQANVLLVDPNNFAQYKAGGNFTYFGGCAKVSPIQLAAPHGGSWYLVVDLGGAAGTVQYSYRILKV